MKENCAAAAAAESEIPVRIVAVVGEGSVSPLKSAPWYDVMLHTVSRIVQVVIESKLRLIGNFEISSVHCLAV